MAAAVARAGGGPALGHRAACSTGGGAAPQGCADADTSQQGCADTDSQQGCADADTSQPLPNTKTPWEPIQTRPACKQLH